MFRRAGLAVVMGQAPEAVKQEADFVAKSSEECGVADAISRFILPRI
jgi:hydroxymethylpyrimidine pyrophosphatase-like HAD family hydrolase